MRFLALVATLLWAGGMAVVADADAAKPARPGGQPEGPVIRISAEIVQVDVTVTDGQGRHVTDLRPEDFVILQDGRPQTISRFSAVSVPARGRRRRRRHQASVAGHASSGPLPSTPAALGRETAPHALTVVLLIDDLSLSAPSFDRMRRGVQQALERLDPEDRVSIVTASRGATVLGRRRTARPIARRWRPCAARR